MQDSVFHKNTPLAGGVRPLISVLKTLSLLDVLADQKKPARLADLARAAGMSRATAHQKLITLAHAGWVENIGSAYRLSLHAVRIASAALEQADLGERVVPFLEQLVARTKETASLAVIEDGAACIVQRVESAGVLRAELHVGAMLDLVHSASGRVLAAFAKHSLVETWRKQKVALPDQKTLAQVRREKFSLSSGLSYDGVRAIAAPVFDGKDHCVAALSLVGPLPRFDASKLRASLERAAARISTHIGALG